MKMLIRNIRMVMVLLLAVSLTLLSGLVLQQYRGKTQFAVAAGENRDALKARYANAGAIHACDGTVLAQSKDGRRSYAGDAITAKAVLHVVGDYTHRIGNTIESSYQGQLLGTDRHFMHQLLLDFTGHGLIGDTVTLTIDPSISKKAYQLLSGRKGAIVMLNYKTGAILASVSSPSTSPDSVIAWKDIPDTSLFDRALQGAYAPGSTFKILTAASWLNAPSFDADLVVDCHGKSTVTENGADESGHQHGLMNLKEAFAVSCNVFFGQIGFSAGRKQLLATAGAFGIGQPLSVDRLAVRTGRIDAADDPATLSWLAIGQPNEFSGLLMSPLQMALIAGAVGNGGIMEQPRIIDHLTDALGTDYESLQPAALKTILDVKTAQQLENMMIHATTDGTGSSAAVKGYAVAGKTGTVQVEGKKNNALYVGYIADEKAPYAIAVVVEEGGAGGSVAAPIAARLLKAATLLRTASLP